VPAIAQAEDRAIALRRAKERKSFTDAQIFDGFFRTAFGAEMRLSDRRSDVIRKYVTPVRVYIENRAQPDRSAQIAAVVADIKARVEHLDIAVTTDKQGANVTVRLLAQKNFSATLLDFYGAKQGRDILRRLQPQCLSGFQKSDAFDILRSDVFLVADRGEFIFLDCAYEELLQSLGPNNDTDKVPWTMFNDAVRMGFFGVYDQYILNILYHPRIRPGMTRDEVRKLLPEIMPDVRAFVARTNGLKGP